MAADSPTLELTKLLVSRSSVTPDDKGCQELISKRLRDIGFSITKLDFGDVTNFWAIRGNKGPILCLAGHTDVVPAGDETRWTHPPFQPIEENGLLFGRGTADMKGALAAMVVATERYISTQSDHQARIAYLITSDEEGDAKNGTCKVVEWLDQKALIPTWCIVGEPSSSSTIGDFIKNGRRGSLSCELTINGVQGHVAYPHLASNPIHKSLPALKKLTQETWDHGNDNFPPTSLQISNIAAGTGATNIIPSQLTASLNFRFSPETTEKYLKDKTKELLEQCGCDSDLVWQLNGNPFLTPWGNLLESTTKSILAVTGRQTQLSTAGGTSDGRFIAPFGTEVVELGLVNESIHQANEHVRISDLETLTDIYQDLISRLAS